MCNRTLSSLLAQAKKRHFSIKNEKTGLTVLFRAVEGGVEIVFYTHINMYERKVSNQIKLHIKNSNVLFREDSNDRWAIQGTTSDTCYIRSLPAFGILNDVK